MPRARWNFYRGIVWEGNGEGGGVAAGVSGRRASGETLDRKAIAFGAIRNPLDCDCDLQRGRDGQLIIHNFLAGPRNFLSAMLAFRLFTFTAFFEVNRSYCYFFFWRLIHRQSKLPFTRRNSRYGFRCRSK